MWRLCLFFFLNKSHSEGCSSQKNELIADKKEAWVRLSTALLCTWMWFTHTGSYSPVLFGTPSLSTPVLVHTHMSTCPDLYAVCWGSPPLTHSLHASPISFNLDNLQTQGTECWIGPGKTTHAFVYACICVSVCCWGWNSESHMCYAGALPQPCYLFLYRIFHLLCKTLWRLLRESSLFLFSRWENLGFQRGKGECKVLDCSFLAQRFAIAWHG